MILGRVSFWACSCYGLDKIGGAMQRRRRLLDIARLPRVIFNNLSDAVLKLSMFSVSQIKWMCHLSDVFSSLWCVDDFRKGKHLAACDPQQLSCSQLFQQKVCVTSLFMFSSLWCGWFQEGETSGSLWSSTALIMLMTAQPVIRTPTWDLPVPCAPNWCIWKITVWEMEYRSDWSWVSMPQRICLHQRLIVSVETTYCS